MDTNKLVIGLTGMPGSGKSLVVEAAQELGYDVVTMGDVIRGETAQRGLEPTPSNVGEVMLELREKGGVGVVAEICVPKILEKHSSKVIVDGLRSYSEVEVFQKRLADFKLITVHSAPAIRFERLFVRGRSDDPKTWEVFHERDMRELSVGIGFAIALAESVIVNDGTKEELFVKVAEFLKRIEEKWRK
ncbi:MAG: AAA family ATPase [Candidatus Bathyarchaeia archaeon]